MRIVIRVIGVGLVFVSLPAWVLLGKPVTEDLAFGWLMALVLAGVMAIGSLQP